MTGPGRWRSMLAIALYGVAVTSLVVDLVSRSIPAASGPHENDLPIYLAFLAYATLGMLILVRRPENRVGWLVGAVGFFPLMSGLSDVYVQRGADWPLADAARWYGNWYFVAGVGTLPVLFLLFPDGRPASRLWRCSRPCSRPARRSGCADDRRTAQLRAVPVKWSRNSPRGTPTSRGHHHRAQVGPTCPRVTTGRERSCYVRERRPTSDLIAAGTPSL